MDFLDKFNRQKLQRITLYIIAALTLLALVLLLIIIIASVEGDSVLLPDDLDKEVSQKIENLDYTEQKIEENVLDRGSLVLVNDSHPYSAPSDLSVTKFYEYRNNNGHNPETNYLYSIGDINKFAFETAAIEYAHKMLVALRDETENDLIQVAGSYGKEESEKTTDIHAGYTMALNVAHAAESDLSAESNAVLNDWLRSNAHKYGFVVRYPADKADITGVSDYDYAFRYVGIPHATYMFENNLCLEEYIKFIKEEHDSPNKPLVISANNTYYIAYFTKCDAGDSIKVPEEIAYPDGSTVKPVISGTNDGGVIVIFEIK